jgi:hypothetical protein
MSWDEGAQGVGGAVIFSNWGRGTLAFGLVSITGASIGLGGHRGGVIIREESDAVFVSALDFFCGDGCGNGLCPAELSFLGLEAS